MTDTMLISVDPDRCTGCRACEVACSLYHTGQCRPSRSAIRIVANEEVGVNVPILCLQCSDAPCVGVCPRDALYRDDRSGRILVREDLCDGCRLCLRACPLGAFHFPRETKKAVKCDLCGGEPQCVEFCATQALRFVRAAYGERPASGNVWETYRSAKRVNAEEVVIPGDLKL